MSKARTCRRIALVRRPVGMPRPDDFRLETRAVREPGPGEVVVENLLLSMDPAIRGFLDDRDGYLPPAALGDTVPGMTLGRVVQSRNPSLREGDLVRGISGWEEVVVFGDALGLERVESVPGVPPEYYLGALGPTGLTAWMGLNEIGRIRPGETVVVNAAAGATGSVAGQVAKLQGCRVVGIAGSTDKTARLLELGFDAAIDYKAVDDLAAAVRESCPEGIDVFFDNVGGPQLEALLPLMRLHGRVIACGMVSSYNDQDNAYGVRTLWNTVLKRLTIRGFLLYDHFDRIPEGQAQLTQWVTSGQLVALQNLRDGLERAPEALVDLLAGRTLGKTLVRLPVTAA